MRSSKFALSVVLFLSLSAHVVNGQNFWQVYARGEFGAVGQICSTGPNSTVIVSDSGVLRTENAGLTWKPCAVPPAFVPSPTSSFPNYVSLSRTSRGTLLLSDSKEIDRSLDSGRTWTKASMMNGINLFYFQNLVVTGNGLFVLASDTDIYSRFRIYKSTDDGMTWAIANNSLAPFPSASSFVVRQDGVILSIRNATGQRIELMMATDTGWALYGRGDLLNWIVGPSATGVLYGGYSGVQRSLDNGAHWEYIALPFFPYLISFGPDGSFYAAGGTNGSGVERSFDNGSSWNIINSGLINTEIFAFTFDSLGYAYAGSFDVIFKGTQRHLDVANNDRPATTACFPNPITNTCTVSCEAERFDVSIFDACGREVLRRDNVTNLLTLDASSWPAGPYICNVRSENKIQTINLAVQH
jgi:hypothetical protein